MDLPPTVPRLELFGLSLALGLASGCGALARAGDPPAPIVRGPLPMRTLEPVKLTYLAFRPRRAATVPEGETRAQGLLAYANMYEVGDRGNDAVTFDGEIGRASLIVRRGLGPRADLEVELPVAYATSGFLDRIVEDFHAFFGFPSGGRDERPRFAYDIVAVNDGVEAYRLTGNEPGLGDVPVALTVALLEETAGAPGVAVRAGVELPTGSEDDGFGNGEVDWGVGAIVERSFGRWTATAAVDWVDAGTSSAFRDAGIEAEDGFDLQLAGEYRWNDRISLLLGSVYTPPPTRDVPLDEIGGEMLSLDAGVAWDLGARSRAFFVFSEDLITQSAPDFTVTAGCSVAW